MEENQFQEIPQTFTPGRPKRSLPKKTVVLIVIIALLILIFLFLKLSGKSAKQSTSTPTTLPTATQTPAPETPTPSSSEAPTPSPTASPTPKPSVNPVDSTTGLDRSTLNVLIENGSGQAGVAVKASDYLTGLGYNVSSTSNADNFNYTNVTIQVKSGKSDFLALLKKDLGFNYTIGNTSSDLPDSASEDALVIIGQ
jgi:hypothetical protein